MYRTPLLDDHDKAAFYSALNSELLELIEYEAEWLSSMANAVALLRHQLRDINWVGFYLMHNDLLVLGPFQGKPACGAIVPGNGVCGTVTRTGETLVVPDVHAFPGHIPCDEASQSEIVLPIRVDGRVVAVLDIDSPVPDRFKAEDKLGLEKVTELLANHINWHKVSL